MRVIMTLLKDERGATAIEYALIATLVSVAALGTFISLGDTVDEHFQALVVSLAAAL